MLSKNNKKKKYWKYISLVVTLGSLIIVGTFVARNWDEIYHLFLLPWYLFMALFIFYFITLLINAKILKLLVNKLEGHISFEESFLLSTVTNFFNLFLPMRGGTVIRAVYLKRQHDFPYSKFLSTIGGWYIILFIVITSGALLSLVGLFLIDGFWNLTLTAIILGLLLILVILFSIPLEGLFSKFNFLDGRFRQVVIGWKVIRKDRRLVVYLFALNSMLAMIGVGMMYIVVLLFLTNINIIEIALLHLISSLSFFINITPASFGIYEGTLFIIGSIIALPAVVTITYALIYRFVSIVTIGLLFIVLGRKWYKQYINIRSE